MLAAQDKSTNDNTYVLYKHLQILQLAVFLQQIQEGQHELTGQRATNFRRDLGAT